MKFFGIFGEEDCCECVVVLFVEIEYVVEVVVVVCVECGDDFVMIVWVGVFEVIVGVV